MQQAALRSPAIAADAPSGGASPSGIVVGHHFAPSPASLARVARLGTHLAASGGNAQALADLSGLADDLVEAWSAVSRIDHVTLLPNRSTFIETIATGPDSVRERRTLILVTLAEAKQFNEILRALGQAYADDFVRAGLQRLREALPAETPVWHVSVLSFTVFMPPGASDAAMAERLAAAFARPLTCRGLPIATRVGIGLIDFDPAALTPSESLRVALVAAQESRSRQEGWARYSRRSDEAHQRAFRLLSDLTVALVRPDELSLHYQPRVYLASGVCAGAEALVRWSHPELGPISPGEFIPLAEATALIEQITDWVVDRAFRQMAQWRSDGIALKTALNISPASLRDPGFVDRLERGMETHRIEPDQLELEFTETAFASHEAQVIRALEAVQAMGIEIAIDDFGTGYSNLSYLTRLPARVIKIDQSFVRPLASQEQCRLLVRGMTDLAHGLGLRVVAEGIETEEIYGMLRSWGCDEGQGYWLSRPMPAAGVPDWLAARV